MKIEILSTLFYNICSAFPLADISIVDSSGNTLLYHCPDGKIDKCRPLLFTLPENYRVFVSFPWGIFEDFSVPEQMIHSLISLVIHNSSEFDMDNDEYSAALVNLANRLLYLSEENGESISFLAASWGLDFHIPRIVCILELNGSVFSSSTLSSFSRSLRECGLIREQELLAPLDQNKFLYCCPVPADIREYLLKQFAAFSRLCPAELNFGVGFLACSPSEYRPAYSAALLMAGLCPSGGGIQFISDYPAEYMIHTLPRNILDHFYLDQVTKLQSYPHLINTVLALIKNNMDLHKTAASLYVHHNTVIFRLKQINKILNLNPLHRDSDRFILILLYLYHEKIRKEGTEPC